MFLKYIRKFLYLFLCFLLLPGFITIGLLVLFFSGNPVFFIQKRVGYKGKIFKMFKFRTMKNGSENEQKKYEYLNEADGPVFKIKNDPRFTKIGKFLCHTGLDELPQFLNVLMGDMEIVGPRPLPVYEAEKINELYRDRESVKPGILSPWLFLGYHDIGFEKWMESDLDYIKKKSIIYDFYLVLKSIFLFIELFYKELKTFFVKDRVYKFYKNNI